MKIKNKKLWQKNSQRLNTHVENYTVGMDYILDNELIKYDIEASMAHCKMLYSIGILSKKEKETLLSGLNLIEYEIAKGKFKIKKSDEDCHTAIENFLTIKYGNVGKKIHTGRSRNDQILTAIRLHMKEKTKEIIMEINSFIEALEKKSKEYTNTIMPGYTHMQKAMPSSVPIWLGSFIDALNDDLIIIESALKVIDQNPLGSVAGYGENILGLNRNITTEILKFSHTQDNPMYCAFSRGKFEIMVLQSLSLVMFDIGKLATDILLFTTKEYDFCFLPQEFTTGSSAMPQKHNYDVIELVRSNVSLFNGRIVQLQNVVDKLPSGYSRGFQLTKEPYLKGINLTIDTIKIITLVITNISMNKEILNTACTAEIYATNEAYKLVKEKGIPFRDAYKIIGEKY
ncbi:MAG: argininosuccinate lyase [bacterium]